MIRDVAIVGLGAMGSAALYQLALRGADVVGIDRFAPPHRLGSSHGESRITRQAIGEGEEYVPLALRSHEIWRELEARTGRRLLEAVGCIVISRPGNSDHHHGAPAGFLAATIAAARRYGIAHEVLDAGGVRERFPQFALADGEVGYFEFGGGYLRPENCVAANLAVAQELGAATMLDTAVTCIHQDGDLVRIETAAGEVTARRVIVSAGAYASALLGPPFAARLTATRQVMHWYELEPELSAHWRTGPVYIWSHGSGPDEFFYGFPEVDGRGTIKAADESLGPGIDPDAADRVVPEADSARMFDAHLRGRLIGVSSRRADATTCLYTVAAGSRFVIGEHPAASRILVVSACSGHGFKHSAAIGEAVAQRVLDGTSKIDLAPFAI